MSLALRREGQAGGDGLGVMAQESSGQHGMEGVGESRSRARKEQRLGRNRPRQAEEGPLPHPGRRIEAELAGPLVGPGAEGGRPCEMQWNNGALCPSSLAENAEGGPAAAWWFHGGWGGPEPGSVHSARPHWLAGGSRRTDRLS